MTDNEITNTLERIRAFLGDVSELINRQKAENASRDTDLILPVRCKDCRFWKKEFNGRCLTHDIYVGGDFYCCSAERKDEE